MSDAKPAFRGEMLMRRWSDSSTQGVQVTFALADASELEPLKDKVGKRFACMLVEINDDETLVQEPPKPKRTDTRGPKCKEACDYVKDPAFQDWCVEVHPDLADGTDTAAAKETILALCGGITSRNELDTDVIAGELFITRVRVPYQKWVAKRGRG